jgi:hypothetical protein
MVEISRFLEMKMKAATFKVYTSESCDVSNCFKAEVGKAFLAAAWRSERYRLRFLK